METQAETTVTFERLDAAAGLVTRERLAKAYLAALAIASGRPAPTEPPHYEHESDWSDYEYPQNSYSFTWGGDDFGLKAIASRPFEGPGELPTRHAFWVLRGLPGGGTGQGHSSAGSVENPPTAVLKLAGPFDPAPALAAFRAALEIDEQDPAVRPARKVAEARRRAKAKVIPPPHFPSAEKPLPRGYARPPRPKWDRDDNVVLQVPPRYRTAILVYERLATHHERLLAPFADPADPFRWSREETSDKERGDTFRGKTLTDEYRSVDCRNGYHNFTFGLHTLRADGEILWTTVNFGDIKSSRTIGFHVSGTEKPDAPLTTLTLHRAFITEAEALALCTALREVLR